MNAVQAFMQENIACWRDECFAEIHMEVNLVICFEHFGLCRFVWETNVLIIGKFKLYLKLT